MFQAERLRLTQVMRQSVPFSILFLVMMLPAEETLIFVRWEGSSAACMAAGGEGQGEEGQGKGKG